MFCEFSGRKEDSPRAKWDVQLMYYGCAIQLVGQDSTISAIRSVLSPPDIRRPPTGGRVDSSIFLDTVAPTDAVAISSSKLQEVSGGDYPIYRLGRDLFLERQAITPVFVRRILTARFTQLLLNYHCFHGLTVEVGGGHAILILGPSGSGKSTIAKALIGRGYSVLTQNYVLLNPCDERVPFFDAEPALPLPNSHRRVTVTQVFLLRPDGPLGVKEADASDLLRDSVTVHFSDLFSVSANGISPGHGWAQIPRLKHPTLKLTYERGRHTPDECIERILDSIKS